MRRNTKIGMDGPWIFAFCHWVIKGQFLLYRMLDTYNVKAIDQLFNLNRYLGVSQHVNACHNARGMHTNKNMNGKPCFV